jgi:hypothetical protein
MNNWGYIAEYKINISWYKLYGRTLVGRERKWWTMDTTDGKDAEEKY